MFWVAVAGTGVSVTAGVAVVKTGVLVGKVGVGSGPGGNRPLPTRNTPNSPPTANSAAASALQTRSWTLWRGGLASGGPGGFGGAARSITGVGGPARMMVGASSVSSRSGLVGDELSAAKSAATKPPADE